jgi:hypothetical protein
MTRIPRWLFVILVGYLAFANMVGCAPTTTPASKFEPNYLYAHALGKLEDMVLDQPLDDTQDLLTEWFGTLDKPALPPLFAEDEYQVHPRKRPSLARMVCIVSFARLAMESQAKGEGRLRHLKILIRESFDTAYSSTKTHLANTNRPRRILPRRFAADSREVRCLCSTS